MQRRAPDAGAAGDRMLDEISNVGDGPMPIDDRANALGQLRESGAMHTSRIDRLLLEKIGLLRGGLRAVQADQERVRLLLDQLTAPAYFPAFFYSATMTPRGIGALVQSGNEKRVVSLGDEVSVEELSPGDEVYLSHERNCLIAKADCRSSLTGEVASFSQRTPDGRFILRSREEDLIVLPTLALRDVEMRPGDAVRFARETGLAFERVEQSKGGKFFFEETPSDSFEDIGGLETEIEQLKRVLSLHTLHGDIAARYKLRRRRSVLLEGPPGNGKTKMARATCAWLAALSKSGRARFMNIAPSALNSVWFSKSEENCRECFAVARAEAARDPGTVVCMFWDEIDAVGGMRGESVHRIDDRVLNALMAELDGFVDRGNVIILAATNRLDALDPALARPGRLGDLVLRVPSPNRRAARSILSRHMPADIPYQYNGEGEAAARELLLDMAVNRIFAQNSDTELAAITLRDGQRRVVRASALVSGAQLEALGKAAVERAFMREAEGGPDGVSAADVHAAVSDFFASAPRALTPRSARSYLHDLPQDIDVVRVDMVTRKVRNPGLYRAEVA